MKKSRRVLTAAQIKNLEETIASAEQKTSGEIVPVIASSSGRYLHANMMVGFLFSLFALTILWCTAEVKLHTGWTDQHTLVVGLSTLLLVEIIAFIVGVMLAGLIPHLKLLFISKKEMKEEVMRGAREAFINLHVSKTNSKTGVVIYISLFEHIVYVQGDSAISEKLSQKEWNHIKDVVIKDIKDNKLADGLQKAILEIGNLLAKHFPAATANTNELSNKVYLL